MNRLWTLIDHKNWKESTKYQMLILIASLIFGLVGFTLWCIIRNWYFSTPGWGFCFIEYPVFLSWILVFLYSCRHDLHNGSY